MQTTQVNGFGVAQTSYTNSYMEGRDNENLFTKKYDDYRTMDSSNDSNEVMHDILKGIIELNAVSRFFFSKKNINHLQYLIVREVARLSNGKYKISPQNEYELLIIMRSMYLQYGTNNVNKVNDEVITLNRQVIYEVVPRVLSGIEQYLSYVRDQGSNPVPHLEHPTNVNISGTKTVNAYDTLFI